MDEKETEKVKLTLKEIDSTVRDYEDALRLCRKYKLNLDSTFSVAALKNFISYEKELKQFGGKNLELINFINTMFNPTLKLFAASMKRAFIGDFEELELRLDEIRQQNQNLNRILSLMSVKKKPKALPRTNSRSNNTKILKESPASNSSAKAIQSNPEHTQTPNLTSPKSLRKETTTPRHTPNQSFDTMPPFTNNTKTPLKSGIYTKVTNSDNNSTPKDADGKKQSTLSLSKSGNSLNEVKNSPGVWKCPSCTFSNPGTFVNCSLCGTAKQDKPSTNGNVDEDPDVVPKRRKSAPQRSKSLRAKKKIVHKDESDVHLPNFHGGYM